MFTRSSLSQIAGAALTVEAESSNRRTYRPMRLALLTVVVLAMAASAWAQASSATLSGQIHDQSGAAASGAAITVRNLATAVERKTVADNAGRFAVAFLAPGHYLVRADLQGFTPAEIPDIVLNVNDQVSIELQLKVGGARDLVTVSGDAGRSSVSPSISTVIDRQFVSNLPLNGRSLQALLQLVPGVVLTANTSGSATSAAQFSVNGQRTVSNNFLVDGVSANTGVSAGTSQNTQGQSGSGQTASTTALGGTNNLISMDALQEFRIETSSFAPEFGRAVGGQISLVSRSGSSIFHGSAAEYFRHDAMDANGWFANATAQPKPRERQYLFSGVIGGPIWADRLFFFGSYENLRLDQPRSAVIAVPSAALRAQAPAAFAPYLAALPPANGPELSQPGAAQFAASYSDPGSFDVFALRVDAHVHRNVEAFVRTSHASSESRTRTGGRSSIRILNGLDDSTTGGATWVIGNRTTAEFRSNWTQSEPSLRLELDGFRGAVVPEASQLFLPGRSPADAYLTFTAFSQLQWGTGSHDKQRQLNAVLMLSSLAGNHQVKGGIDYRRLMPVLASLGASFENIQFNDAQAILNSQVSFYQLTNSDPLPRRPILTSMSAYIQDTWRIWSRATITYGLRYDGLPVPDDATGRMPRTVTGLTADRVDNLSLASEGTRLWNPAYGIAPRVGVAYRLNAHRGWETHLRAGGGKFFDLGLGTVASQFGAAYPFYQSKTPSGVSFPISPIVRTPPSFGVTPPGSLSLLDPSLRLPYAWQWNASGEQSIGQAQSVTVSYVGASDRDLLITQAYLGATIADWPGQPLTLLVQRNRGRSRYHALQLKFERRLHRGLQAMAGYAIGRSTDIGSGADAQPPLASESTAFAQEWGPAAFDIRHQLSAALIYELPGISSNVLFATLTKNWGLDVLLRAQSAPPVNPTTGIVILANTYFAQRPDRVVGVPLYLDDPQAPGGVIFNKAAFSIPVPGTQGSFPRNGLRGFGMSQVDMTLRREFSMTGAFRCQLRVDLFNVFNHPNFGVPNATYTSALFGRPTQSLNDSLGGLNAVYQMGGPRSGQLAVKLLF